MISPGSRWKSQVCQAEAIVVRPTATEGVPQCGGRDMVKIGEAPAPADMRQGWDGGCSIGKRYRSDPAGLELLCTKAGKGTLGFAGEALVIVESKKLPSSD
jgi:hypothetical protein